MIILPAWKICECVKHHGYAAYGFPWLPGVRFCKNVGDRLHSGYHQEQRP